MRYRSNLWTLALGGPKPGSSAERSAVVFPAGTVVNLRLDVPLTVEVDA
jgi:hypothetical protein